MRRKGERKLVKTWSPYAVDAIRHMIATGTDWFQAWIMQACTPLDRLARASKVDWERVHDISAGALPTRQELTAFAAVWNVDVEVVISTIPDPAALLD
jgi:hypothetical protein